jgi:beta-lactamase regulating signal transducer with metallopeptidase domain
MGKAIVVGWLFPLCPRWEMPAALNVAADVVPVVSSVRRTIESITIPSRQIFMTIWIAGVAVAAMVHIWRHICFMKRVRCWREPVTDSHILQIMENTRTALGIRRQVALRICPSVASPMLVGLIRPMVLLPSASVTDEDVSFILRHELYHVKRSDLWYKALILTATVLHWCNPLVYVMAKSAAAQCEISCDELVLQGASFQQRKQYGAIILGIIRSRARGQTALSTHFGGGKKKVKNRIAAIVDIKPKRAGVVMLCMAVIGIAVSRTILASAAGESDARNMIPPPGVVSSAEDDSGRFVYDEVNRIRWLLRNGGDIASQDAQQETTATVEVSSEGISHFPDEMTRLLALIEKSDSLRSQRGDVTPMD